MIKTLSKKIQSAIFLIALLLCAASPLKAQSGQYLQLWGGPQLVGILNYDDYSATNFAHARNADNTYRAGGGFDYINNFNQNYGWQTGLYYSGQGQKYNGWVPDINDTNATKTLYHYDSEAKMDYIRVPLMFRFNSIIDEGDRLNLSIFFGLQAGYLTSVTSYTSDFVMPDSIRLKYSNFDLKQLYHSVDFGMSAGAQFNIKLKETLYLNTGIRFDRSIANIENTDYVLPSDAPIEYQYPLSTKKESSVSHKTVINREPSKHISVNVFVGLSFRLKKGAPEKRHPVDDLPQNQ
jgi:hypothetical protein